MRGPNDEGLVVVVAQPLDLEMIQRLRWQAEDERSKGAAACQAVVTVVRCCCYHHCPLLSMLLGGT